MKEKGRRPRNGDAYTLKIVAYEHLESSSASQMKAGLESYLTRRRRRTCLEQSSRHRISRAQGCPQETQVQSIPRPTATPQPTGRTPQYQMPPSAAFHGT